MIKLYEAFPVNLIVLIWPCLINRRLIIIRSVNLIVFTLIFSGVVAQVTYPGHNSPLMPHIFCKGNIALIRMTGCYISFNP
jgi:hypothetical protein